MAKKVTIGAAIALDGEKEYRKAISGINSDMKVLSSEMKLSKQAFEGNENSVEALTSKGELLNKQLDKQKEKVEAVKAALEKVKEQYGENDTRTDKWKISLNNAEIELTKLDREIKTNDKYLDEAKTSTTKAAKSIDQYGKEVKSAGDNTLKTGDIIKANLTSAAVIGGVQALGSAIGNTATKTVDLVKGTASYADDMLTLSTQTGISTDELQAYNYMAELTDTSMEDMTKSMAKNIKSMTNAQEGSKKYTEAYEKLNVKVDDGNHKLRDSEDVYWDVIDALKGITDQTERDSISMQLFGKSAQDLNPLIAQGSEGVKKLAAEARNMGAVLDKDTLDSLGKTDDALQRLYQATDIAKRKIGAEMAPAVAAAAEKITAEITDMDGKFTALVSGGLEKAVDGFTWIIDNSDLVIAGLGGIAAGMITGAAVGTITSAVGAFQTLSTAIKGAATAQEALNLAEIANPIGLAVTAVAGLTAAMIIYAKTQEDTTSGFAKLEDKIKEVREENDKLAGEIKTSGEKFTENTDEVKTNYGAIELLADKLYKLADKENKSNAEKAQMKVLVDQLNESLPGLNLVLNEQTGILNKQRPAIEAVITSMKEQAMAQTYQEQYLKVAKQQVTAQENLKKAIEAQEDAQKNYNEALQEQKELQSEQTPGSENWWALKDAQVKVDNFKSALDDANVEVENANDNLDGCGKKFNALDEQMKKSKDSVDEFGNTVKDAGKESVEANEEAQASIKKLTDTYNKAVKDRTKEIKSAMGLFDKFAIDTKVSGKTLMNNLQSQIDGVKNWADNLKTLAKKGISKGLLKELEDMGPQAASQIGALSKLSEPELKKYSDMWKEESKLAHKQAVDELSGMKKDIDKKTDEMNKSTESKLYNAGENSVQGYINGFKVKVPELNAYVTDTFGGVATIANNKLGIHSPSTVFKAIAGHTIDGFVLGIKEKKDMAGKSMQELGEEIISKAQQHLDNYKVYHNLSLKDEAEYWNEVRKECKKGTQARVDADKNYLDALKSYREELKKTGDEILSDARTRLDNYEVYHDISLSKEISYWNKIRKEIKKGSQARIDADKEYYDVKRQQKDAVEDIQQKETSAQKDYKENCKKINEDMVKDIADVQENLAAKEEDIAKRRLAAETTYADGCKEINSNLTKDIKALNDAYSEALDTRTKSITGAMGLFDEFKENDVTGDTLISNLRGQDASLAGWMQNLSILKSRGVDNDFIKGLQDLGVGSAGEVKAIVKMTDSQLTEYVGLWKNKNTLAKSEATAELESMKAETSAKIVELNAQAKIDLAAVKTTYDKALADLDKELDTTRTDAAAKIETIKETAMAEIKTCTDTYTNTLKALIPASKDIGGKVADGLVSGIKSRTGKVNAAMSGMVEAAIIAAKKAGNIHSPSQKTAELVGEPLAQGIEVGFVKVMNSSVAKMANAIPTDFDIPQKVNSFSSQTEMTNLNTDYIYNAVAAVAIDILVPALRKVGANFNVQADKSGLIKVFKDEATDFYNRTGKGIIPV